MKIFVILLFVGLSACVTLPSLESKTALIGPGDTRAHVLEVLGPAADRQFLGKNEAWQYCQASPEMTGRYHDYRTIWFYDGLVTGISSRKGPFIGRCTANMQPIKWEEAPDKTIEIRAR